MHQHRQNCRKLPRNPSSIQRLRRPRAHFIEAFYWLSESRFETHSFEIARSIFQSSDRLWRPVTRRPMGCSLIALVPNATGGKWSCISASPGNTHHKLSITLWKTPTANRYEAAKTLIEAAGGKLISMYSTPADGPGVLAIFDVTDPAAAAAISGVVVASGTLHHVKLTRLLTQEEVTHVRHTAAKLRGAYKPPGK